MRPASLGYVATNELRIKVEGAFRSFGRQNAHLRAQVCCLLFRACPSIIPKPNATPIHDAAVKASRRVNIPGMIFLGFRILA